MKSIHIIATAAVLMASTAGAQAPQGGDPASHQPVAPTAVAAQSEGEVRKVDMAQGKVTLRHGPLENLDMPAMTMVFTAVDPRMLQGLKQGDKVRFIADKKDGTYVITAIRAAD